MKIIVKAHVNSKHPRIVATDESGIFNVYVSSAAVQGKANEAIAEALAQYFDVSKTSVALLKGHTSKTKVFEIVE